MKKWKFGSTVIAGAAASLLFLNCPGSDYGEIESERETGAFENERYGAADEGLLGEEGLRDQTEVEGRQYGDNQMSESSEEEVFGNGEVFGDGDSPGDMEDRASQTFDTWDADNDERLTQQEFSEKFFQEFDTDNNGVLDREEWMRFSQGGFEMMDMHEEMPASQPGL